MQEFITISSRSKLRFRWEVNFKCVTLTPPFGIILVSKVDPKRVF